MFQLFKKNKNSANIRLPQGRSSPGGRAVFSSVGKAWMHFNTTGIHMFFLNSPWGHLCVRPVLKAAWSVCALFALCRWLVRRVLSKGRKQSAGQVCVECRNAAVWSVSKEIACRASGWSSGEHRIQCGGKYLKLAPCSRLLLLAIYE